MLQGHNSHRSGAHPHPLFATKHTRAPPLTIAGAVIWATRSLGADGQAKMSRALATVLLTSSVKWVALSASGEWNPTMGAITAATFLSLSLLGFNVSGANAKDQ